MESPQERPFENQQRDLVTRFRDAYRDALRHAQVNAEHTQTQGWRNLYAGFAGAERQRLRDLCIRLGAIQTNIDVTGPNEDDEKELGEIKNALREVRAERAAFSRNVVQPIKACADEAEKLVREFRAEARRDEEAHPLHSLGLVHLLDGAIQEMPAILWDERSGSVRIVERPKSAED